MRRARDLNIEGFVNIGTDASSSEASLKLAQAHDFIWASAGIHPHDAKDANEKTKQIPARMNALKLCPQTLKIDVCKDKAKQNYGNDAAKNTRETLHFTKSL